MTMISDFLLRDGSHDEYASTLEMNPLTDRDALLEAQILDIRLDALTRMVGVIFDLRQALQLRQGNTGLLVGRGVRAAAWTGSARDTALTAWTVGGSVPKVRNRGFTLDLAMWPAPGARLELTAESAAFFTGDAPGLGEAPPDLDVNDRRMISDGLAGWGSPFEPVAAAFVAPARGAA
ncbi:hypothetical protein [Agromyces archimandritae]|uniref:Uncharacterized protein n=1 Tax=Agromyces archimandritae TaxID=2781962 RepID=A0A975FL40_9MICO|nr:hypothetical protein [Agromyces archimandritae]QTX04089.1 hypothetical protein G127AT_12420 [Agromyces archimandritae]